MGAMSCGGAADGHRVQWSGLPHGNASGSSRDVAARWTRQCMAGRPGHKARTSGSGEGVLGLGLYLRDFGSGFLALSKHFAGSSSFGGQTRGGHLHSLPLLG